MTADLSQNNLSEEGSSDLTGILAEEAQRRKWKGLVLGVLLITAVTFYLVLFFYLFKIPAPDKIIISVLGVIPTLLLMKLSGLVAPIKEKKDEAEPPIIQLLREALSVWKDK